MNLASSQGRSGRILRWLNAGAAIVGLAALAFLAVRMTEGVAGLSPASAPSPVPVATVAERADAVPVREPSGKVLGEEDAASAGVLKSENFTLAQVSMGGDVQTDFGSVDEFVPFEISFVRGEAFLEKNKKEVRALVTWKTSRLAQSSVRYGKSGEDPSRTVREEGYGSEHSVVLSGLEPASTYVYSITARDRAGREISTESYAIYTGAASASLFDLISGAVEDAFGWAIGK
jgi:hypothetical protein